MGVAIGDALGFAREGLSRRTALKMFGRPKLKYQLVPSHGFYSDDTPPDADGRTIRSAVPQRMATFPKVLP